MKRETIHGALPVSQDFFISNFEKFCEFAKVTDVFKQLIVLTTVS